MAQGRFNKAAATDTSQQIYYEQAHGSHNNQYNAQTQNHYYPAPARDEPIPNPISTVPFPRNPNFVERDEWYQLKSILSSSASHSAKVALVGLGGSGKSQLASQYCHHIWAPSWNAQPSNTWVLWIHVNSSTRLEESIRDLVERLEIPRRNDPKTNIFQLFHSWLRDPSRHWLLVLDNVDDPQVLFEPLELKGSQPDENHRRGTKRPIDFLSSPSHGHVILTTRYRQVASKFLDYGETGEAIRVGAMEAQQATTLLRKRIEQVYDESDLEAVATELGYVPLALVQAAAYIRHKPCPVRDYLTKLRQSANSKSDLLTAHVDPERKQTSLVLLTWQITFEHIRQIRPSAADRLSVMCFFDHRSIPNSLLAIKDWDIPASLDDPADDDLQADIRALRDFDLVTVRPEDGECEMHPLVPFAVRNWLVSREEAAHWHEQSMHNISKGLPEDAEIENWPQWQKLYPHVQLVIQSEPQTRDAKIAKAAILHQAARYQRKRRVHGTAVSLGSEGVSIRRQLLGEDDKMTIRSEYNLALALFEDRQTDLAEEKLRQVWRKCQQHSGEADAWTLNTLGLLVEVLNINGKHVLAEKLSQEALSLCEESLRLGHSTTLHVSVQLIEALWHQKKHAEVKFLSTRLLREFEKQTGKADASALSCAHEFANALILQGEKKDGVSLRRWELAEGARLQGSEHPDTLLAMYGLATDLMNLSEGDLQEAEKLMRQAYVGSEIVWGEKGKLTLMSMHNLALICRNLGRHEEAVRLMGLCAERSRNALGSDHARTIARMEAKEHWETEGRKDNSVRRMTEELEDMGMGSSKCSSNPRGQADRRPHGDSRRHTEKDKQRQRSQNSEGTKKKKGRRARRTSRSPDRCIVQ
ncbi:hypothetical protein Q7P37_002794 [Cladosporium fusiforme]